MNQMFEKGTSGEDGTIEVLLRTSIVPSSPLTWTRLKARSSKSQLGAFPLVSCYFEFLVSAVGVI